ncbi:CopM family metallochaperone [Citreimonas sp.]|uniref:CopM family metallochaperone n=1 Tax=Citreimonas sp. TaxID=3036715 RepID=UPI004058C969
MKRTLTLATALSLMSAAAMAQGDSHGTMHGSDDGHMMSGGHESMPAGDGHQAHGPSMGAGSPAAEAYRAANLAMHEAMDFALTGDADVDFARGMIGHHRGAIDMARIVLEHGEDPGLRQLAEEVIAAQEAEIAYLENWLAENAE